MGNVLSRQLSILNNIQEVLKKKKKSERGLSIDESISILSLQVPLSSSIP